MHKNDILARPVRVFLPESFAVTSWDTLKPFFENLLNRSIASAAELRKWFEDRSELEAVIGEDMAWRYIRMTCYTENKQYLESYQDFIQHIQPEIAPVADQLNRKAAASPFLENLVVRKDRNGAAGFPLQSLAGIKIIPLPVSSIHTLAKPLSGVGVTKLTSHFPQTLRLKSIRSTSPTHTARFADL